MAIYFDHAATTPLAPEVQEAFVAALATVGNPSSIHSHGQASRALLEDARERLAREVGADSAEVTFTSGGTESINTAIKGLYWARQSDRRRNKIVVAEGEHHATIAAAEWLEKQGAEILWVPLDEYGRITPDALRQVLENVDADEVALASVIWVNNEIGTVQPIAALADVADEFGIPLHVDAVSALGYVQINFSAQPLAALSISAHKIGGPVGVGALILSRNYEVESILHGGDQQRGRSGTMDVAGAVAFASALELSNAGFEERNEYLRALRDRLIDGVQQSVPGAVLRGAQPTSERASGNVHFTFEGCQGDSLLYLLDSKGISVSTGSACHAGVSEVSHVLLATGLDERTALGALRFSLGKNNTEAEIDELLAVLPELVEIARRAGVQSAS